MNPDEFAVWMNEISDKIDNGDFQPGLQLVKGIVQAKISKNFHTASDADGRKWEPRKPQSPKATWPLEIKTGLMKDAIVIGGSGGYEDNGPTHCTIGIDAGTVPYAVLQDQGTTKRNHPPRPYADIDDKTADDCQHVFGEWLFNEIFGA
jgi:hypothetical protein